MFMFGITRREQVREGRRVVRRLLDPSREHNAKYICPVV